MRPQVDHGDGEVSFLGHLQTGSIQVKEGQHVTKAQVLEKIGFSGDAFISHLHYMLMAGPDFLHADGLPSCCRNLLRIPQAAGLHPNGEPIDTGDFVIAGHQCAPLQIEDPCPSIDEFSLRVRS